MVPGTTHRMSATEPYNNVQLHTPTTERTVDVEVKRSPLNVQFSTLEKDVAVSEITAEDKNRVRQAIGTLNHRLTQLDQKTDGFKSVCRSDLSILIVLGMALKGMKNPEGRAQFKKVLGLEEMEDSRLHGTLGALMNDLTLNKGENKPPVQIVNALATIGSDINPSYRNAVSETYGAEIFSLTGNSIQLAEQINLWASGKTNRNIEELVKPTALENAKAVLLNAIHFEAFWERFFQSTKLEMFTCASGKVVPAQLMKDGGKAMVFTCAEFSMVEKTYKSPTGRALSFVTFIPNSVKNLSQLAERMTPEFIKECREKAKEEYISFCLPKLDMHTQVDQLLNQLKELGMPPLEMEHLAEGVFVSDVIHQCKIHVDEKGTTASAATAAVASLGIEPPKISANRAFFFAIMDGDTQLFSGAVRDESALINAKREEQLLNKQGISGCNRYPLDLKKDIQRDSELKNLIDLFSKLACGNEKAIDPEAEIQMVNGCTYKVLNFTQEEVFIDGNRYVHVGDQVIKVNLSEWGKPSYSPAPVKSKDGYVSLVDRGNGTFLLLCRFPDSHKAYKVTTEIDRSRDEVVLAAERTVFPDYMMMEEGLKGVKRKVCTIEDFASNQEVQAFLQKVPSHIPRDHLHIEEHTYSSGETLRFFSFMKGYSLWCKDNGKKMYLGKQELSCGKFFESGNVCLYDDPENNFGRGMGLKIMVGDDKTKKAQLFSVHKPWSNDRDDFWSIGVETVNRWEQS